jgi:hypothetical protein
LDIEKAPKKFFPGNVGDGKGGGTFSRHTIPKLHVFDQFCLKTSKFPNKKGTFDVNLVFTATLACTKRALPHKKGHFWYGHMPPPPVPTPLKRACGKINSVSFGISIIFGQ